MGRGRHRIERSPPQADADAGPGFVREKLGVVSRFRPSTSSAIKPFEIKLNPDSATLRRQRIPCCSGSRSVWRSLPQPQKTLAAFRSDDCCLGHPKVKWFALERSPNVSHATTIAQSTRITAGYLWRPALSAIADRAPASAKVLERR
jgi:hypothetical protein